jgi:hypothetical protein
MKAVSYLGKTQKAGHSVKPEVQVGVSSGAHCDRRGACGNFAFPGQIQATGGTCDYKVSVSTRRFFECKFTREPIFN